MKIVLITADGKEITPGGEISLTLTQTADAPCDSLALVLPENTEGEIERVVAYKDDKLIFNGYCDCQKTTVDDTGVQTYIYARSSACLLVDNDAFAYTYNCPTALSLFNIYAKDLGFTYKLKDICSFQKYEVSSGSSLYGAINTFVSMITGNTVRINPNNEAVLLKESKDVVDLDKYYVLLAKSVINRSEPISEVRYKKEFSSAYDCHTYSKLAENLKLSRCRYVNLASLPSWQRNYKISKILNDSFKTYKQLEIKLDGYCDCELYQRFKYDCELGKFDDYLLCEKVYSYSKSGEITKLILRNNIDIGEVNYVD